MTTDNKTLADVQPGGRVRLGDAPWPEIDAILADAYSAGAEGLPFEGIARRAAVRKAVAVLSAQPSPGGQGDALAMIQRYDDAATAFALAVSDDHYNDSQRRELRRAVTTARNELVFALAARQPVGAVPSIDYEDLVDQAKDLFQCGCSVNGAFDWLLEQLTDSEAPAAPPAQCAGEPVAWMTHHDEPMLFPTAAEAAAYCEDDEQPVPLFRSPAQAVDLGQFRDLAEFALSNAKLHNCWEKREALARDLLALIDGKAVGNV